VGIGAFYMPGASASAITGRSIKKTMSVQPPPVTVGIETPGTGLPAPGNMAYFGGPVMTTPKAYLVFWGWGGAGADPNGVDTLLTRFFQGVGGSSWAGVVTQYYDTVNGANHFITNPAGQLAGTWYDDASAIHDNLSSADYAAEAGRAVAHFNGGAPDPNANYIVATPQKFNDAGFNAGSYCAYHDYTSTSTYPGVTPGVAFTVMPYVANLGSGCGAGLVNTPGTLDGVTMVAGHEYLEAVTDPTVFSGGGSGGWVDTIGNENADKCAYVTVGPGSVTNVTLSTGTFPVQGTWSNQDLSGTGACSTG
jgi:hypothetical protein